MPAFLGAVLPAVMAPMRSGRADPQRRQQSNRYNTHAHEEIFLGAGDLELETAGERQPYRSRLDRMEVAIGNAGSIFTRQS